MTIQQDIDFQRIADAIRYIIENARSQPSLDEIAEKVHLSPAHFQRMFTAWAGTSPKKFLQYLTVEHAKSILLSDTGATLLDATLETGLSSTSRLHDLFVTIEGMSPAEYRSGGRNLKIHYSFFESLFGTVLVASTDRGICYLAFVSGAEEGLKTLKELYWGADISERSDEQHQKTQAFFNGNSDFSGQFRLHLKGTDFQLKVWQSLLKIPTGYLSTYGQIAGEIGKPGGSRAVGSAIGSNPVAYLIPCHRVIRASGVMGGYMWGTARKAAIIAWESARTDYPSK